MSSRFFTDLRISYENDFDDRREGFHVANINIHSLRNKRDLLEAEMNKYGRIHVIVVTESWVMMGFQDNYDLAGYIAYHVLREDGYAGLVVYVRSDLRHTFLRTISTGGTQVALLQFHSFDFKLVAVYRQPRNDNVSSFVATLEEILDCSDDMLLVGDTNFNLLKSEQSNETYLNLLESNSMCLLNRMTSQDFTFPIAQPRPGAPGSLVDHFATNFFPQVLYTLIT